MQKELEWHQKNSVAFGGEGTSWRYSIPKFSGLCDFHLLSEPPALQWEGTLCTLTGWADGEGGGGMQRVACWNLSEVHRRLAAGLIVFLGWAGGKAKGRAPV